MKPARSGSDGFTLLEVLVALALTSLVLAALPSTLRLANAGLRQANAALATDEVDRALDLIEQKLGGAIPLFQHSSDGLLNIAFTGTAQSVSFVAPLLHASNSGLFRYTLSSTSTAERDGDVVLTLQPYQPDHTDVPVVEQRILRRGASLSFRYLRPSAGTDGPQWANSWTVRDTLPKSVMLTLSQPRSPPQSRVVELHLRDRNDLN